MIVEEASNDDLIEELLKRAVAKNQCMLIIYEEDETDGIIARASKATSAVGLAEWYKVRTMNEWKMEDED